MGVSDKARSVVQSLEGKAKEVIGDVADDDSIRAEGEADRVVAHAVRHDQLPSDEAAPEVSDGGTKSAPTNG